MHNKTVDLDVDAYTRLDRARLPGESFSEVVRRAYWPREPLTAADLLAYLDTRPAFFTEKELDQIERAESMDLPPSDPWR